MSPPLLTILGAGSVQVRWFGPILVRISPRRLPTRRRRSLGTLWWFPNVSGASGRVQLSDSPRNHRFCSKIYQNPLSGPNGIPIGKPIGFSNLQRPNWGLDISSHNLFHQNLSDRTSKWSIKMIFTEYWGVPVRSETKINLQKTPIERETPAGLSIQIQWEQWILEEFRGFDQVSESISRVTNFSNKICLTQRPNDT